MRLCNCDDSNVYMVFNGLQWFCSALCSLAASLLSQQRKRRHGETLTQHRTNNKQKANHIKGNNRRIYDYRFILCHCFLLLADIFGVIPLFLVLTVRVFFAPTILRFTNRIESNRTDHLNARPFDNIQHAD